MAPFIFSDLSELKQLLNLGKPARNKLEKVYNKLMKWFTSHQSETEITRNSRIRISCKPFPSKAFCPLPWESPLLCLVGCSPQLCLNSSHLIHQKFYSFGHLAGCNLCLVLPSPAAAGRLSLHVFEKHGVYTLWQVKHSKESVLNFLLIWSCWSYFCFYKY